ncbi:hypothetical protein OPV22_025895 [Ensete ventricosum]|uniref:Uncharacterized protein n=1 Tax=Ensete ventricosum TaxID=4639 RepID=A0AAV8QGP6_ENSVE|nr:hypothetical protein OPV22_025895 [Ensete ventricosum]
MLGDLYSDWARRRWPERSVMMQTLELKVHDAVRVCSCCHARLVVFICYLPPPFKQSMEYDNGNEPVCSLRKLGDLHGMAYPSSILWITSLLLLLFDTF